MTDELLPYYERELKFIRTLSGEFAERNAKIAGRLRLGPEGSDDPHVERIIQAFALLNARLRHKLDDDFPEIAQSLLEVVYPHFLRPIPSMAIAQLALDRGQDELVDGHVVERGTPIETEPLPDSGLRCRYQTGYPLTLWPIEVTDAAVARRPFAAPTTPRSRLAKSVLRLQLDAYSDKVPLSQFQLPALRFYLHGARSANVYRLYEALFHHTIEVAVAAGPGADPVVLPRSSIRPVGFERDEGLLPYPARSFVGYRLLTEYFAFPRKFLFFDLVGLAPALAQLGQHAELFFYFDRLHEDLEQDVTGETFQLGCTPIVNLFEKTAEPFELKHNVSEHLVQPDARYPADFEVYSIESVEATAADGSAVGYEPFFSFKHATQRARQSTFWHASLQPARRRRVSGKQERDEGRDVYLAFVDLGLRPSRAENHTIRVRTTCLNRNPHQLPSGPGRPALDLPEGRGVVGSLRCLSPPTPIVRPELRQRVAWKLISHLSLNHLSLEDSQDAVSALREILALYDLRKSAEARETAEGIARLKSRRIVGRVGSRPPGFGQGVEIELELDESKFAGGGAYLFSSVLDRFFALYTTVNSFTKLIVSCRQRAGQEPPWQWPSRTGERALI